MHAADIRQQASACFISAGENVFCWYFLYAVLYLACFRMMISFWVENHHRIYFESVKPYRKREQQQNSWTWVSKVKNRLHIDEERNYSFFLLVKTELKIISQ